MITRSCTYNSDALLDFSDYNNSLLSGYNIIIVCLIYFQNLNVKNKTVTTQVYRLISVSHV